MHAIKLKDILIKSFLQNDEKLLAIRLLNTLQKKLLWTQVWLKEYNTLCIFLNNLAKAE